MGVASRALCCPCRCLAALFTTCFCTILATLAVFGGIIALIVYVVFHPRMVSATVDSVSLSQFELGANAVLRYNLTVAMTVRNPNTRLGLYFDGVESRAFYDAQRFGYAQLAPFFQASEGSLQLAPAFTGQLPLDGGDAADDFRAQHGGGVFTVEVALDASLRARVWALKIPVPRLKVFCPLTVPEPGNTAYAFKPTACINLI